MRPLFGKSYIRVRLGSRLYTYYCPGAKVGDLVELPPNSYKPWRQQKRVVKLGRRYLGCVREAKLVR